MLRRKNNTSFGSPRYIKRQFNPSNQLLEMKKCTVLYFFRIRNMWGMNFVFVLMARRTIQNIRNS